MRTCIDGIIVLQLLALLLVLSLSTARDPKCDLLCEVPVEKGGCKCDNDCNCQRECFAWQVHTAEEQGPQQREQLSSTEGTGRAVLIRAVNALEVTGLHCSLK